MSIPATCDQPFLFSHSDKVEDITKIHRKVFCSGGINSLYSSHSAYPNIQESCHAEALFQRSHDALTYFMKLRSLVQYFIVLGNPSFLHFRPILISLINVVSTRLEMGIKC
ncbi:hypothetical protein T10_7068 [Trichinella papuae]|uniref:Uncharacterized protein n=1 Tax=Trichinella papuae TaxID=268474 RepID=A0A0V1MBV7_9BILA|nr:hypothetical protein T10_7068 [Trichinella papuae]